MTLEPIKGTERPEQSGSYPVYVGNSPSAVIGYFNSRDARWFVNGYRVASVEHWLGPDPLPERKAVGG